MARDYKLVSGDSHVNEPPNLWQSRVPAKFKDRAPRMERFEQGDAWVIEGAIDPINFGLNQCASDPPEKTTAWIKWEDCRRGGYDPAARVAELDEDNVDAELLYPTPRVGNATFWNNEDRDFHLACIRAYNDWLSEEYANHAPDRLFGLAMMPTSGTKDALDEFDRALALPGMQGIVLGQYPHGGGLISEEDDPFWAAAEKAGVPVSIHVAFATLPAGDRSRPSAPQGEFRNTDAPVRASQLIYSGVFDRFPKLQVVFAETDCGWVPYAREQLDVVVGRGLKRDIYKAKELPSYYFSRNLSWVFITDVAGLRMRDQIGVDRMLWSSDHAHSFSHYPETWKYIDKQFVGIAADEKHALLAGNALRLYGITNGN
jgi:predicted TIM-barrel fold metal-dependent hydrolase